MYTVDETDAEHIAGRPDSQTRSSTNYKEPLLYLHHSRGASSKFGELSCWLVTHCNLPEADLFPGPPEVIHSKQETLNQGCLDVGPAS